MITEYYILKAILEGLTLNLSKIDLFKFVNNITDCSQEQFDKVYEEVQKAWIK